MASIGSKGNKKRNSSLQKEHYKSHKYRLKPNKIKKIERHLRKLAKKIARCAKKGRVIHMDEQAVASLERVKKTPIK